MSRLKIPVGPKDHVQGDKDAVCTLVEYGDYECPHCGSAYPIVKRVQKHFGKRLRFVFRNFPLSQIHPNAESAAEASEFSAAHGKYWQMHDSLFENQDRLGIELYEELAQQMHLPSAELVAALEENEYLDHIRADFSGGVRSGVNGTPTFFIKDQRHDGPFDYDSLVEAIETSIASVRA